MKNAGPSMKTAPSMEGSPEKAPTFHKISLQHGRSPAKTQDLPLAWKVPLKKRRPSMKTASNMEGPHEKAPTFLGIGLWYGRSEEIG